MSESVKTWVLKTVDGRDVYIDSDSHATLDSGSNTVFEFREGEHSSDNNKEDLAKKVSEHLGVECVWHRV
jgi:hypothetical protein